MFTELTCVHCSQPIDATEAVGIPQPMGGWTYAHVQCAADAVEVDRSPSELRVSRCTLFVTLQVPDSADVAS